jgi:Ion channel
MITKMMHFWSEERSLTTLLVLLAINMFILEPVIREGGKVDILRGVFFSMLLLAGLLTMTRYKALQIVFVGFIALTMVVHWTRLALGTQGLIVWDSLFSLVSVLALTGVVLAQVIRGGPVTGHRVRGAVAGYLLLGLTCSCAFALIDFLIPGAFQTAAADYQFRQAQPDAFVYFSIVTLTTLGYGDITAVHPVARSVVMMEALLGQLYPAILIARLVTLEMETRKNKAA